MTRQVFSGIAFLATWLGCLSTTVKVLTGIWGGRPNDPLWVGPVATAIGLVAATILAIAYVAVAGMARDRRAQEAASRCAHAKAVLVESAVTGETLAALCPACDIQLPVVVEESCVRY